VPAKGATSVAGQVAAMPTLTKATKKRPVTVRRTVLKSCSRITRVGVSSSLALLLAPIHPNFVETEFWEVHSSAHQNTVTTWPLLKSNLIMWEVGEQASADRRQRRWSVSPTFRLPAHARLL
jgi:hypothetical protein